MDALAKDGSRKNRVRLYRTILDVILIIPVAELPSGLKPGTHALPSSLPLQFPLVRDASGSKLVPVFSDVDALRNWDPNTPYIGLKSVELFKIALTSDADQIVINAFDPIRKMIRPGGTLTREEFQLLAEERLPSAVVGGAVAFNLKPGETVFVGRPTKEPSYEVVEALLATAKSIESVSALYLAQIAAQKDSKCISQTLIGIGLSGDASAALREEILQKLVESIRPSLEPQEFMDFMFTEGPLGQQVMSDGKLIYERSPRQE